MSGTFASSLRDEPDYYLCPICADRYTMERGRPCHACLEQEMIDTFVPGEILDPDDTERIVVRYRDRIMDMDGNRVAEELAALRKLVTPPTYADLLAENARLQKELESANAAVKFWQRTGYKYNDLYRKLARGEQVDDSETGAVTVSPEAKQRLMDEFGLTEQDFIVISD